jgi:hypothetical protein
MVEASSAKTMSPTGNRSGVTNSFWYSVTISMSTCSMRGQSIEREEKKRERERQRERVRARVKERAKEREREREREIRQKSG